MTNEIDAKALRFSFIVVGVIVLFVVFTAVVAHYTPDPGPGHGYIDTAPQPTALERCVKVRIDALSAWCQDRSRDMYDYKQCMGAQTERIGVDCAYVEDK